MAGSPVKTFSCPACGGTVTMRATGHSITAVCVHCSTLIDTANENLRIIQKNFQKVRSTAIPIGAKGILDSTKWEVIGYVEKKDVAEGFFWEEYLLFNPYFGFRFLTQADGHWNIVSIIKRDLGASERDSEIKLDGEKFSVFNRGKSQVEYVKGEFYWRVRQGDTENYGDFIAPPRMLTIERNKQEVNYSLAEYLLPEEVEQAFEIELPKRTGVAPNQPPPFAGSLGQMWKAALLALFAAFFIQLFGGSGDTLYSSGLHVEPGNIGKAQPSEVFLLPARGNVVVQSSTALNNNWLDLDLSLVNDSANSAYEATQGIEYYSGVEDGESWREGSTRGETYFSAVEPGAYRLLVEPTPGQISPEGMTVSLVVKRNVPAWGNFWITVLFLFLLPVYALCYRWYFENKRWANSDYAPAIYRSNSDDFE